jgi:hypothetical protein
MLSVSCRHRFQRGFCCAMPWSTVPLNRKLSFTNPEGSAGAAAARSRQRRYPRQSSTGIAVTSESIARRNSGWATLISAGAGTPSSWK